MRFIERFIPEKLSIYIRTSHVESLLDTNLSLWSYSMLIFPLSQQYFFIKIKKIENYYFIVTSCRNLSDKDSSLKHSATKKSNSGL